MHIFFLLFVLQMLLILGGIETNRGPELPIDDELSSSLNDSSEMSSIYAVGLLGKLGADLSTLVIFVVFFRHFFKTDKLIIK
jgi:hypothetical protein